MLFGGWAESKPKASVSSTEKNEQWVVIFPEVDPEPMEVVMNIIHGRFHRVSQSVRSITQIYQVLELMDLYDMTHLVHPWTKMWSEIVDKSLNPFLKTLVSWLFGDEIGFENGVSKLCRWCAIGENGELDVSFGAQRNLSSISRHGPEDLLGLSLQFPISLVFHCLQWARYHHAHPCWSHTSGTRQSS